MNNSSNIKWVVFYLLFTTIIAVIFAIGLYFQQQNELVLEMAKQGYEQKVVNNKVIWVKVKEEK